MTEKNKNRTLIDDLKIICQGMKRSWKLNPLKLIWSFAYEIYINASPYFGMVIEAMFLNELVGDCNPTKLVVLAIIAVFGIFVINYIRRFIESRNSVEMGLFEWQYNSMYMNVQNDFQYKYLEDRDVVLKQNEIVAYEETTGSGWWRLSRNFAPMIGMLVDVILSVTISVTVIFKTVSGEWKGFLGFVNSPIASVIIIGVIIANLFLSSKLQVRYTEEANEFAKDIADQSSFYQTIKNMFGEDVTVFNMNKVILPLIEKYLLNSWVPKALKTHIRYGRLEVILNFFVNLAVYIFVAAKVFIGVIGLGDFNLYRQSLNRFVRAISGLAENFNDLRANNKFLLKIFEYTDLPNDMYKGTLAVEKRDDIDYEIEFRDVSFKYPGTDSWVIRHVNMKFKIGDKLAIVGQNGSGKTTFIKLLCRLYDPTEGRILLNGIDITRYRYDEYIKLFSVVFQDYALFSFSLGENIAASSEYDEGKVSDCLIRAGMGEKLSILKDGVKTYIGRDYDVEGVDFSGGEKQKIALARALYKDAPFVILDEPTAALDPLAEAEVYKNFNTLVENKTSVFISHRLSSCRFCDNIAVFDNGYLVQQGSHDILVKDENGKYRELWLAQAGYYTV